MKRGPQPKISPLLLDLITAHFEIAKSVMWRLTGKKSHGIPAAIKKALRMKPNLPSRVFGRSFVVNAQYKHYNMYVKGDFGAQTMQLELESGKVSRASKKKKIEVQEPGKPYQEKLNYSRRVQ
jgi:hypothetical protein